jgi:hypothetical protein
MKKIRFSEEQLVKILREADEAPVPEAAKKLNDGPWYPDVPGCPTPAWRHWSRDELERLAAYLRMRGCHSGSLRLRIILSS